MPRGNPHYQSLRPSDLFAETRPRTRAFGSRADAEEAVARARRLSR